MKGIGNSAETNPFQALIALVYRTAACNEAVGGAVLGADSVGAAAA